MERVWCPVYPSRVRCNRSPSQERSPEWWGARRTSGSSNSYGNALPGVPASPVHQNMENASLNRLSSEKYVEGTMSFTAAPASGISCSNFPFIQFRQQIAPVFKQKKMELTSTTLASVINHNPPWIPATSHGSCPQGPEKPASTEIAFSQPAGVGHIKTSPSQVLGFCG